MIDIDAMLAESIAKVSQSFRPEAIPISATRFAILPSATQFEALANGSQFQAGAGLFCRMVATAAAECDAPLDRVAQAMLGDQQRELSQMWQYAHESLGTTPDPSEAAELKLMAEVMTASVFDHGARSDRRQKFFQSVVGGELEQATLSQHAINWLLCK